MFVQPTCEGFSRRKRALSSSDMAADGFVDRQKRETSNTEDDNQPFVANNKTLVELVIRIINDNGLSEHMNKAGIITGKS